MIKQQLILFDLGGVLVELGDELFPASWFSQAQSFSLIEWFTSDAAREFETGKITPQDFVAELKEGLQLTASLQEIEYTFTTWVKGLYPGVPELIEELKNSYDLAVLSNTNELHEPILRHELGLEEQIDTLFLSHLIGLAKPEASVFEYVIEQLDRKPSEIIFFDDNAANIKTARLLGMHAFEVKGPNQIRHYLAQTFAQNRTT